MRRKKKIVEDITIYGEDYKQCPRDSSYHCILYPNCTGCSIKRKMKRDEKT
jgi:hypothetical protein